MLTITDATLCAVCLKSVDLKYVRMLYTELLNMGISYVQIPEHAVELLNGVLDRKRTVLQVSADRGYIPGGFCGYLSTRPGMPGRTICEACIGETPQHADEIRWTADAALFIKDYAGVFQGLASEREATFCTRNAGELSAALTVEWILAGGGKTVGSLMGIGRYAPLEEVLAALYAVGYPLPTLHLGRLHRVAKLFERMTGMRVPAHKPVVGKKLFSVESGVHVDGIAKDWKCYEPFPPEAVGAKRRIVIGKHSGRSAIALKLKELGLAGEYNLEQLLDLARAESIQRGEALNDKAFAALARSAKRNGIA